MTAPPHAPPTAALMLTCFARGLGAVLLWLMTTALAAAQPPATLPSPSPELELRVGALWPEAGAESKPAVGLRVGLRPWPTVAAGRISLQVTADFRSFGGNDGFDDVFLVRRRIARNRLVVGAAVGVDLVQQARTTVDVRVGGALLRTRTKFLIDSSQGFVNDGNVWENVCPFEGFKERCSTAYAATGLVSVSARRGLTQSGLAFVGADYSILGNGQHLLLGTFGIALR